MGTEALLVWTVVGKNPSVGSSRQGSKKEPHDAPVSHTCRQHACMANIAQHSHPTCHDRGMERVCNGGGRKGKEYASQSARTCSPSVPPVCVCISVRECFERRQIMVVGSLMHKSITIHGNTY